MSAEFHPHMAKGLFNEKRGQPENQPIISFLTKRVKDLDENDWKKLLRMMSYIKGAQDTGLALEANNLKMMLWFISAREMQEQV